MGHGEPDVGGQVSIPSRTPQPFSATAAPGSGLRALSQVTTADTTPCPQIWWLDPELTYGNAKPFVFTQGHSVCNRSFFPCFDTPAVKCTYSAVVKVGAATSYPAMCTGHSGGH